MSRLAWLEYDGMKREGDILRVFLGWGSFPLKDYIIHLS